MILLTHFRPMFHLCRNQVVGFYEKNVWKYLWKSDILRKDAALLKMSLFRRCFSNNLLVKTNYLIYP